MTDLPTTDTDRMPECGTCRFFAADDDQGTVAPGARLGTCHRYPPNDHPITGNPPQPAAFPQFPVVFDGEWCGEHVAAKVADPEPVGDIVEHEPHVVCGCGHELAMHSNDDGACLWQTPALGHPCPCDCFEPS